MYRCAQCGSPNIQAMAWVRLNTDTLVEYPGGHLLNCVLAAAIAAATREED